MDGDAAFGGHLFESLKRLGGTEQNCAGEAFPLARDVQAKVGSIDKVNIGKAGGAEHDGIARRESGKGVRSGIFLSEIGFDFNDAGGEECFLIGANEELAEKFAGNAARGAGEERAG